MILYSDDPNRAAKINILNDYLEVYRSRTEKDSSAEFLPDFMQAWSYAVQTNNDYLATSVSSILALLLKTLATLAESRDHGILLCRTLLKPSQLKLISRAVAAPKHKEHIISPSLRILTEIVSFDGGLLAKSLYSKREWSLESKIMARNLGLFKGDEDRRRPSIRSNAIRYLLANFKYQDEGAKIDILKHGHITKALFDHLKEDPVDLLEETFNVLEIHILRHEAVPRITKSHTMSDRSLSGVLAALRVQSNAEAEADAIQPDTETAPATKAKMVILAFLTLVCTTSSLGVLRASGWYPPGSEKHTRDELEEPDSDVALDLGLDSIDWYERYHGHVPVRNTILSGFLQTLRPHGSEEERELLLATFAAGPELVADYFFNKADKFPFDPKLTNTWIGYATFLYSAVEVPFPTYFGPQNHFAGSPPPISIAIENILPLPLSQKVLTRCLNQSSDLITFFAIRIMVVAFQKLQTVLRAFDKAAKSGAGLWREASHRLVTAFCQRCPPLKDVVATFRKVSEDSILQREAVSRLIHLYYEVTPQLALEEKFDISASLTTALERIENMRSDHEQYAMRLLELQHLLGIAQNSIGMRWWHKQGSLKFSPFVTLIRLCAQMPRDQPIIGRFFTLIKTVITENDILQNETERSAAGALIASLVPNGSWTPSDATYIFLDECLGRVVRKPVKYLDDYDSRSKDGKPASLLLMVFLEQAPFAANLPSEDRKNVTAWLALFWGLMRLVGESPAILKQVQAEVNIADAPVIEPALVDLIDSVSHSATTISTGQTVTQSAPEGQTQAAASIELTPPPAEKSNRPELLRWQQKELDESLENGDVSALIYCLSSQESSVRLQCLAAIRRLSVKIQESTHEDKDQLHVLLGELTETAASSSLPQPLSQQPLPYLTTAFANHAMNVILNPSHFMYPKVNKYLNKGPAWQTMKLPSYWVDRTILEMPEEDDKHWAEIEWVLEFFVDGTRTLQDALLLISRNTLEKVMSLFAAPSAPKTVKERIVQLVHRVAVAGGATSLATRAAIVAWLEVRESLKDVDAKSLEIVSEAIVKNIDVERIGGWSKGSWTPASGKKRVANVAVSA